MYLSVNFIALTRRQRSSLPAYVCFQETIASCPKRRLIAHLLWHLHLYKGRRNVASAGVLNGCKLISILKSNQNKANPFLFIVANAAPESVDAAACTKIAERQVSTNKMLNSCQETQHTESELDAQCRRASVGAVPFRRE